MITDEDDVTYCRAIVSRSKTVSSPKSRFFFFLFSFDARHAWVHSSIMKRVFLNFNTTSPSRSSRYSNPTPGASRANRIFDVTISVFTACFVDFSLIVEVNCERHTEFYRNRLKKLKDNICRSHFSRFPRFSRGNPKNTNNL